MCRPVMSLPVMMRTRASMRCVMLGQVCVLSRALCIASSVFWAGFFLPWKSGAVCRKRRGIQLLATVWSE